MSVTVGMCADCGEHRWPLVHYQDMWLCLQCIDDREKAKEVLAHATKDRRWVRYELVGGQMYTNGRPLVVAPSSVGTTERLAFDLLGQFGKYIRYMKICEQTLATISLHYEGEARADDVWRMALELAPAGVRVDVTQLGL